MLVMLIGPVAAPLIGAGITALGSLIGGERANRQTKEMAREQMAFQERMSNTSYQRAVQDMELAGINPMLAFQQGGASSPGGASATIQDVVSPAISTAQQARRVNEDLKLVRAQVAKVNEDRLTAKASGDNTRMMMSFLGVGPQLMENDPDRPGHKRPMNVLGQRMQNLQEQILRNQANISGAQAYGSRLNENAMRNFGGQAAANFQLWGQPILGALRGATTLGGAQIVAGARRR